LHTVQGNLFIAFVVLTNALEDPNIIGGRAIEVTNTVLKYSYVGLLLTCFILALQVPIRPQSSNRGYTLALMGHAVLTAYMTVRHRNRTRQKRLTVKRIQFAVIFLAIKGVQQVVNMKGHSATFSDFLRNVIFRDIVLPLSITVGSYVAASIIHVRDFEF
jgi:chitin synthase